MKTELSGQAGRVLSGYFLWGFGVAFPIIVLVPVVLFILLLTRGCAGLP